jgi:hypothetical protein
MAITDQITGATDAETGLEHYLARTNNLSDLQTVATALVNLGIDGTGVATALGNDVNTNGGLVTASTTSIVSGSFLIGGGSGSAVTGLVPGSGFSTFLVTPSSANLRSVITDETGQGALVFGDFPQLYSVGLSASIGSFPPLTFNSGPLVATAAVGGMEYDGKVLCFSPDASNRGVVASEHLVCLTSANTLTNSTSIQPIFDGGGGPANGAITLVSGTYFFDMLLNVSGLSGSAHTITLTFGGTATIASIRYGGTTVDSATLALNSTSAAQAVGTAGTTTQTLFLQIRGVIRVSVGGTIIPQITQGTNAAAASVAIDSYLKLHSVGAHTVASVGNWS